jgi:pimeloyl-ACP methyl ester carboxylesterase
VCEKHSREAFDSVFRACEAETRCRDRYPDLSATFTRLVRDLEASPAETSVKLPDSDTTVKVVLDGGALVNWMVRMISNGEDAVEVPFGIDQLARGRPEVVAEQWASFWVAPEFYGLAAYGLTYGVACTEWVPYEAPSEILGRGRLAFPEYPDSVLAEPPQLPFLDEDCRVWNVPKAPESVRAVTESAIPTLVVSGGFDGKTGAQWGDYVARKLSNSSVVTIPGVGHGAVIVSPCAQSVTASFFRTPDAPDLACVATLSPKPFKVS